MTREEAIEFYSKEIFDAVEEENNSSIPTETLIGLIDRHEQNDCKHLTTSIAYVTDLYTSVRFTFYRQDNKICGFVTTYDRHTKLHDYRDLSFKEEDQE